MYATRRCRKHEAHADTGGPPWRPARGVQGPSLPPPPNPSGRGREAEGGTASGRRLDVRPLRLGCASGTQHRGTPDPLLAWRPRGGRSAHGMKLRTPGALRPRYKSHLSSGGREMSTCSLYGRLMQSEGQGKPLSYLTAILFVCVRVCACGCVRVRARFGVKHTSPRLPR